MKYTTLAFLLSLTFGGLATPVFAAEDNQTAPAITASHLQAIHWQPVQAGENAEFDMDASGQTIPLNQISGKVLALQLPAGHGTLTLRLRSLLDGKQVFAPNVLVLDQNQQPAAFYSSNQFSYQPASLLTADRLEGTLKLAPAPDQKSIYLLIYTTPQDVAQHTTLEGAAKAYAKATGNQPPNIPDPIAQHSTQGHLSLKVTAERNNDAVTIGNGHPDATSATGLALTPAKAGTTKTAMKPLPDTEHYFNQQIEKAVKQGNLAQAMTLVEEAERLGSTSARPTFINSIQPRS